MLKEEFNYDVFVSHAGEDTAWSEKLAERLRHEGLRVWFDKWEIKPGDHLLVKLNEGLASSAKMVTVWSSNYFRDGKTWTLAEVFSQLHQDPLGKTGSLIPLLIEDCRIPPTCLNQVYVDFRRKESFESAFLRLIDSLPPRTYASWEDRRGKIVKGVVEKLKDGTARLRLSSQEIILQTSEALQNFKIVRGSEIIYYGKAVVTDVIPRESDVLCLASLDPINTSQFLQAVCTTTQGAELRATSVRISDDRVIVEFPVLKSTLRISDILSDFQIFVGAERLYSGNATIHNLLETGTETLCELVLDADRQQTLSELSPSRIESEVNNLVQVHGKQFLLKPRFRSTIDDLESFLRDIRSWCELLESRLPEEPTAEVDAQRRDLIRRIDEKLFDTLNDFSARFEDAATDVTSELDPQRQAYARMRLHPFVLCSPFGHRSYKKPLGYAGDYEVVNLLSGNPYQGASIFACVMNAWLVRQTVFEAYRAITKHETQSLIQEVSRVAATKPSASACVLGFGCGPAIELQDFLKADIANACGSMTLVDFNNETIEYTRDALERVKSEHKRQTVITLVKRSVHQVLKDYGKNDSSLGRSNFDFVYCGDLFNYLSDKVCRVLLAVLFDLVAPGGLLLVSCMDSSKSSRKIMEYLLEWHLIYRTPEEAQLLWPEKLPRQYRSVISLLPRVHILQARRTVDS